MLSPLVLGKCVATLRGAFFGAFLNGTHFFNFKEKTLMEEKKKINKNRIILCTIALITILITIIFYSSSIDEIYKYSFIYFFIWINTFAIIFAISSFFSIRYKTYYYNKNTIIVYAGWSHHYIKVNGTIYDEHTTILSFTPIKLSCNIDENTQIDVTISLSNKISLKINNKLLQAEGKN